MGPAPGVMAAGGSRGSAGGSRGSRGAAPLLVLCWLCCWPDDPGSDTSSSGKHPQKPIVAHGPPSSRAGAAPPAPPGPLRRRAATSAASLHLPGTSGGGSGDTKQPLSAHRSHEEIPSRRRSNQETSEGTRYHSAPSVIHEVLHRRDWERSTKDLYIPLKPDVTLKDIDSDTSSPEAPRAEQESSSIEGLKSEERLNCKKHYTNIKSSRNRSRKESTREDIKDVDTTEGSMSNFYIGDAKESYVSSSIQEMINNDVISNNKVQYVKKMEEETHSIKSRDRSTVSRKKEYLNNTSASYSLEGCAATMFGERLGAPPDRSGAEHHDAASFYNVVCSSRASPYPPSSVEAVGYGCFLEEEEGGGWDSMGVGWEGGVGPEGEAGARGGTGGRRGRHASDGDLLAPALRPESGAFSESDLDLESSNERPPPYEELAAGRPPRRAPRETAI